MIFYFSGTGNSRWVASQIAATLGDSLINIGEAFTRAKFHFTLADGERIGFVFPVHSWGPAPIVVEFARRLRLANFNRQSSYAYAVAICGDDIGLSMDILQRALPEEITLKARYSVQMPNNYILLPGFDTDAKSLELTKLMHARGKLLEISEALAERRCRENIVRGSFPALKSKLIYPLYRRFAMSDKGFSANSDLCNKCGLCVRKCPVTNITMIATGPQWHGKCQMCLACIHHCPKRAIEYGTRTTRKGRYYHPAST
ncbi:MAG: EFR1 family ferrodoxin [Muribaculaceae bacterium]|nr:EFR1 family ferrodoxin [Muribaculaceae bacterium]